jgi:hypothetical protein
MEKAKQLETAYRAAVKKANDEIDNFAKDKMPSILEVFYWYFIHEKRRIIS